jgi:hypothetical protein
MEFASFLAGERWSDHPQCTHPLLAELARDVNDLVGDEERQQLVRLVPQVVGRLGDARTWLALPVAVATDPLHEVPEQTQRVLAAGLLRAAQLCAESGPHLDATRREARAALDLVPRAAAWAERFQVQFQMSPRIASRTWTTRSAPMLVRCAAEGIVHSGAPDPDRRLRALLEAAIVACPAGSVSASPAPALRT